MAGQFTLDIRKFVAKAGARLDEVAGRTVFIAAAKIDARSPVDTGLFRGNWQLGVDRMPAGTLCRLDPSGAGTQQRIREAIPEQAAGHVYYIANNLPYAQRLEHGWSKQAPRGMIALTVVEMDSVVKEAVAAAKRAHP